MPSTSPQNRPQRRPRLVVPERVRWAIEVLDPAGAEEILEVGGGPGVAAALVCERLTTGQLVAVDRSRIATERIAQRNTAHMASGRLTVQQCSLAALTVPHRSFDKAFAINVNLFWVADPSRELQVLSRALRPSGVLYILFGTSGPTGADRITGPIGAALHEHGFTDVTVVTADAGIGVTARAPATIP
ncbi:MAG: class I SAM-dependent methyltransferase [Actinobacteria bacterium]|nr:class I SAM-dependent methyltransferase [Actinomycetota bacterium]